ncbi:UNVERIFIED_CONTAM: hypothetical protein Sradi_0702400 [Sesamum radiatum]|uniref:Uncharacterized protein n=1 Tax=Sesamum radiatum TaxID=300843 RepID=A0AAW2VLX8_SESRA
MRPCRKASKHVGLTVRDHCEMLAYQMDHGLKMRSYSGEAHRMATAWAWADDARVSVGHETGVAGVCGAPNAEAGEDALAIEGCIGRF